MEVSQKPKNRTIILSSNPTTGYISKGNEISVSKRYLYFHVHCSIIRNSQMLKQPKCPLTDEWIKKMLYTYTQ